MKKNSFLVIISLAIITLTGCKKDVSNVSTIPPVTAMEKIKAWYEKQRAQHSSITAKDQDIPVGMPQWDKAHYYVYPEKTVYITPMNYLVDSTNANQFIIVEVDAGDNVVMSEYAYILLNTAMPGNYDKEKLAELHPEAFDFTDVPTGLSAWIMKYDFEKKFLVSKYLEGGKVIDSDNRFKSSSTTRAPKPQCTVTICIDWYYQVYENGILIYEEYLYSTCNCTDGGTGGGGGPATTTPPDGGGCNMTTQQAQAVINQMYGQELYQHSGSGGIIVTPEGGGIITQGYTYKWMFYKLDYIANYSAEWAAYFPGVRYKNNPSDQWKWLSLSFSGGSQSGGTIPICFASTCSVYSTPPLIKPDGSAAATITYTLTTHITCLGGVQLPNIKSGTLTDNDIRAYD